MRVHAQTASEHKEHKTELAYIGRAPFKSRLRSPASSLVDFSWRSQQPCAAAKFLGLIGFPRRVMLTPRDHDDDVI
jgi:hypothetical protein